jgi:hypothetical protein
MIAQGDAEILAVDPGAIVDEYETSGDGLHVCGTTPLSPRCIINFVGLYLVQDADGYWYMGEARDDGVIHCWSSCGDDLEQAIRAL